jgi:uncharacterized protein
MGSLGISVFFGMEQSVAQNVNYLKLARKLGYSKLFTSLHIPEADYSEFIPACRKVLAIAAELGFEVTADVSPRFWQLLGIAPQGLRSLGINALRVDYGFEPQKVLELATISQCNIELNASVVGEFALESLLSSGLDCQVLRAGHNYYPRPETGLSFAGYMRRSEIFQAQGIPVSVFIPCMQRPRGPIFAGLPTVESHRTLSTADAVRQLWASRGVETILFGDPMVPESELEVAGRQVRYIEGPLQIRVKTDPLQADCESILWAAVHTNRLDAAEYVVRSEESRALCASEIQPQLDAKARKRGDVTIDNLKYGRYMGELQIILRDLPADERVNVVGRIAEEDLCLLECLTPGRSFRLEEALS